MFKVHVENSELLLEDCRAGASGWLRLSLSATPAAGPSAPLASSSSLAPTPSTTATNANTTTTNATTPDTNAFLAPVDIEQVAPDAAKAATSAGMAFHAVYGLYSLLSGPYVAVIKDARVIGSGPASEKIYCVHELALLPVSATAARRFFKHASPREQADERAYIRMLQSVLASRTFYFAYDYDLTLSAQRRAAHAASPTAHKLPMWQRAEDAFFWNKPVLAPFIAHQLHHWIVPVISGFVKVLKKCEVNGMRCDLLFFTRRSWRRVGTRFNVRGVDKDGSVANFAETEMLVVKPSRAIVSYVQVRGSIPLYWDQVVTLKYMPRTRYAFSGSAESIVDWNELAFRAHMDTVIQRYGHVTVVNLIDRAGKSKTVRDQAQLGTAFGKYVKRYNQQSAAAFAHQTSVLSTASYSGTTTSSTVRQSPSKPRANTTADAPTLSASTGTGSGSGAVAEGERSPSSAAAAIGITRAASSPVGSPTSSIAAMASSSSSSSSATPTTAGSSTASTSTATATASSSAASRAQLFAEPIVYVWFDFHHECRKMKWHNLSKLVDEVEQQFAHYGWFECDGEGRVLSRQRGVFRVNCMDNLDRTNVVMSLFARRAILTALGLHNDKTRANVLDSPYDSFEVAFKHTWADNADYVSKMYAGTGALKTDFTRTGKRTLAGALQDGINSVTRYYLNNFADGIRQDSYDLLVANYVPDRRDESPFVFQQQHSLLYMLLEWGLAATLVIAASVSWRVTYEASALVDTVTAETVATTTTAGMGMGMGMLQSFLQPHHEYNLLARIRNGALAALVLTLITAHFILKKGAFRSLGRRYVCKPAFCSSGYIRRKDL